MKANNLSISIPNNGCDKNCLYCISKMTEYINYNNLFKRNLKKVKEFAKIAGCNSILLTGKGEPLLNLKDVCYCINYFKEYPIELQTNGIILNNNFNIIDKLYKKGLNVIAFSIDNLRDVFKYGDMFKYLNDLGIIVRVTIIISKKLEFDGSIGDWIIISQENYINQLSFRNITVPEIITTNTNICLQTIKWVKENSNEKYYDKLTNELKNYNVIKRMPFGAIIYNCEGISITSFDYCIQEKHKDDDIRSLIYMEDGHLYTSWSSKASILF